MEWAWVASSLARVTLFVLLSWVDERVQESRLSGSMAWKPLFLQPSIQPFTIVAMLERFAAVEVSRMYSPGQSGSVRLVPFARFTSRLLWPEVQNDASSGWVWNALT